MDPARVLVQRRIEWPDTDASGYYHNTAAFRFIEVAETALLERLGILHDVYGRLPRVHVDADFKARLAFRDVVDIELWVDGLGNSSITYRFEMRRDDEIAVSGSAVAALLDDEGRPASWPEAHRELLLNSGPQEPERLVVG